MRTPNLFDYATKELSQDAVICWLIAWAQSEPENECEQGLREVGGEFIKALLAKFDVGLAGRIQCPESPEIHRQALGIDVLARINDESAAHVLLIEDKTDTHDHSGQLDRYYREVTSRPNPKMLGEVTPSEMRPIYLKTGNQSRAQHRAIENNTQFRVFTRREFLHVLNIYRGTHPVMTDFREHLQRREDEFNSFKQWKQDADRTGWSRGAWEGFYRHLEIAMELEAEEPPWGFVPNRSGGFLGFWWHWKSVATAEDSLYLQLEVMPGNPDKQKLCFKVEAGSPDRSVLRELKEKYHR